ncbi:MAG: hydrogenase maturation protease [Desulfurivibrio sp.]|nr:hydrogenase maturation protease [Desulfurivibrio sp.]
MVIGLGNRWRQDDGVGLAAAEALRRALADHPQPPPLEVRGAGGEPAELMALWAGYRRVWLIDALLCGAAPGTIHWLAGHEPLPQPAVPSSHGLGLAQAVELARALGELPPRLTICGVEPARLGDGNTLSPAVAAVIPALVDALLNTSQRGWPA